MDWSYPLIISTRMTVFRKYPILVEGIRLEVRTLKRVKTAVSFIPLIAVVLLVFELLVASGPLSRLSMMVWNIWILGLVFNADTAFPSRIASATFELHLFSPIAISNPFRAYTDRYECTPNEIFVKRELECNLLSNYGEDIITKVHHTHLPNPSSAKPTTTSLTAPADPQTASESEPGLSRRWKICEVVGRSLGLPMFFHFMDCIQLFLLGASFIHLHSFRSNQSMLVGLFFCLQVIIYYCAVEYCRIILALNIWRKKVRTAGSAVLEDQLQALETRRVQPADKSSSRSAVRCSGGRIHYYQMAAIIYHYHH